MASPLYNVVDVFKCQVVASIIALVVVAILGHTVLFSFFLGEAIMVLGNGFLAWRVYRQRNRLAPMPMLFSFLGGEFGKYIVIIVLTILIAKLAHDLNWLFYVIGMAIPQIFGVIVYLVWCRHKKSS